MIYKFDMAIVKFLNRNAGNLSVLKKVKFH